jgi:hypothetical protein
MIFAFWFDDDEGVAGGLKHIEAPGGPLSSDFFPAD